MKNSFQQVPYQKTLSNPFDHITEFEDALASYTGAKYAVMTDCCTHALELSFLATGYKKTQFTPYTYISIPMMLKKISVINFIADHLQIRVKSKLFKFNL